MNFTDPIRLPSSTVSRESFASLTLATLLVGILSSYSCVLGNIMPSSLFGSNSRCPGNKSMSLLLPHVLFPVMIPREWGLMLMRSKITNLLKLITLYWWMETSLINNLLKVAYGMKNILECKIFCVEFKLVGYVQAHAILSLEWCVLWWFMWCWCKFFGGWTLRVVRWDLDCRSHQFLICIDGRERL